MTTAHPTIPQEFWRWARERAETTMLRQKELGIWRPWSWGQVSEIVGNLTAGLVEMGIQPGDPVGILASTGKDWVFADLGAQTAGAVVCGLHASDPPSEVQAWCRKLGLRVLFVENEEQLDKVVAPESPLPELRHIIAFHMEGLRDLDDSRLISLDDLLRRGAQVRASDAGLIERRLASRASDDVAAVLLTSGTTGPCKGAMLSHANILAACEGARRALFDGISMRGERVLFLPLSHVMERIVGQYLSMMGGAVMNFVENPETVLENVREVQPDVFVAVPRIWERMHSTVAISLHDATALQRWSYARALAVGRRVAAVKERGERPAFMLAAKYWLARVLVLNNLRRMMGLDRVRLGVSGVAPISPQLIRWYRAMGIDLREAWGLTETSGVTTVAGPHEPPGSVGKPTSALELRLSERGEILVRGATVCGRYAGAPDGAAILAPDGWLHSGDLGRLDDAGRLHITERMEDIIVLSSADKVVPSEWENRLKSSPYITDAVIVGDRRPHLTCLVLLDQDSVAQWAQDQQVVFSDFRSLCDSRKVIDLVAKEIERVNGEAGGVHRIEGFRLIDGAGGALEDALTPTLKLKRRYVLERHADVVESLYESRAA